MHLLYPTNSACERAIKINHMWWNSTQQFGNLTSLDQECFCYMQEKQMFIGINVWLFEDFCTLEHTLFEKAAFYFFQLIHTCKWIMTCLGNPQLPIFQTHHNSQRMLGECYFTTPLHSSLKAEDCMRMMTCCGSQPTSTRWLKEQAAIVSVTYI